MGLHDGTPLQHIESIVSNIIKVLIKTGAISRDPTGGKPNPVYYAKILQELKESNFDPGPETLREDRLVPLSEDEWGKLMRVGTDPDPLEFARCTTTVTGRSRIKLDEIVERLKTTRYYIIIRGNASTVGDPKANEDLARERANRLSGSV